MRATVFFISLCLFLLGGSNLHAGLPGQLHSFSAANTAKAKNLSATVSFIENTYSQISSTTIGESNVWLTDDVEDEDDRFSFIKKNKAVFSSHISFPPFYIFCYRYKNLGSQLPVDGTISCKYILQRNLRI